MKSGAIIIHSSSYTEREKYVKKILKFFESENVEVKIAEGVITEEKFYDARFEEKTDLSKGQIGCALAHMNALKVAIDSSYDEVFIFEDDVTPVGSYSELRNWLDSIKIEYDLCLLTNVGLYQGVGHDGRNHVIEQYHDILRTTCPFGTQAYYLKKEMIKLLYDTQKKFLMERKLHIADGLHIHCEKDQNSFLEIITPIEIHKFFIHAEEVSIVSNL